MPIGCAQAFGTLQQQSLDISVRWHLFSRSDSFAFHLSSSQLFSISTQLIFIPYHLISSHVVSSQLSSPHLISSHLMSSLLFSALLSDHNELFSSFLMSSELFSSPQLIWVLLFLALLSFSILRSSSQLSSCKLTLRSSQFFSGPKPAPTPDLGAKAEKVRFWSLFESKSKRKMESAKNIQKREETSKTYPCNFDASIPMRFASSKSQKTMELRAQ